MATDSFVQVPVDGVGKKVDASSLDVGTNSVLRQRIVIGDNSASSQYATVTGGALNVNVASGLIGISGTAVVAFSVPQVINNISATVNVVNGAGSANMGGVSLVAGTANIGFINNISATVNVAGVVNISGTVSVIVGAGTQNIGAVSLGAGAANIGFINSISAPVQLAAGAANIGLINDISATIDVVIAQGTANIGGVSLVAGTSNIGFIDHISATVNVAFAGGISLAAGTANIGFLNHISATVNTSTLVSGFADPSGQTRNVVDSSNLALRVNVVAGSSGGVSLNDGGSYTATSAFVPIGGVFDDVASSVLGEGLAGAARVTANRAVHVNNRTDGGANMDDSTNAALRVNVVAGAAGGVSLNDGASYTATSAFVPIGGVFNDVATTIVGEDKAGAARITTNRAIHVNLRDNAGGEISSGNALSVKVERVSATASVVLAAGTANIGTLNDISKTVSVIIAAGTANIGGVSLVAGTSNIGFLDSISRTVNVAFAGGISLASGTANIGFINNISATVNTVVGAGTQNIGGVSLVAGTANIGFINNISATVNVAGIVNISNTPSVIICGFRDNSGDMRAIIDSANVAIRVAGFGQLGSLPIGGFLDSSGQNRFVVDSVNLALRVNIAAASATVTVVTANPWLVAIQSVSHGPRTLQLSTSATATFIAAPGAGFHIYVTSLACSNAGTVATDAFIGWSASIGVVAMACAPNGGGFVMNFDPPWKVQSNESVNVYINHNTLGNFYVNANFFVAT